VHQPLEAVDLERAEAPVVVESDEVLLADALRRAEKLRQLAGHAEVPPVAGQGGREDAELLEQRVEDPQDRAQQRDALLGCGRAKPDLLAIAEDIERDRARQVDLQPAPLARARVGYA